MVRTRVATAALLLFLLGGAGLFIPGEETGTEKADKPAELEIVVNIAARRLDVLEKGKRTRTYSISPGARDFRTPLGEYRISKVIWNPWWHPPNSGWARGRKVEPPGVNNPMGRVKLHFSELLYIHGTPLENQLGEATSHGCIRMSNKDAIELARLVHRYATPSIGSSQLDALVRSPQSTRSYALGRGVPLRITYQLAEVRDGRLEIHRDVYRRTKGIERARALEAIARAGIEASAVRTDRLDAYLKQAPRGGIVIPLESLIETDAVASSSSPL